MKNLFNSRSKKIVTVASIVAVSAITFAQFGGAIGGLIKVIGVTAVVSKFGPQINIEINKVAHTPNTYQSYSKVVPILTGGINSRKAVGMAQVRGTKSAVNKVNAVAMIDQGLLGLQVKVMIPIASKNVISNLTPVPGVGVTGIVDIGFKL